MPNFIDADDATWPTIVSGTVDFVIIDGRVYKPNLDGELQEVEDD